MILLCNKAPNSVCKELLQTKLGYLRDKLDKKMDANTQKFLKEQEDSEKFQKHRVGSIKAISIPMGGQNKRY